MGEREYPVQDAVAVLGRFSERRSVALPAYQEFMAAGFRKGPR